MKPILTILITALLLVAPGHGFAATSTDEPGCSLFIKLKDGSCISGKSLADGWQFYSDAWGDFKPNVMGIRSIEMAADSATAQLTGTNGDKLNVRFAAASLPVDTIFGKIDVPVKSIISIEVLGAGNPKTLPAGLVALWSAEGNGADLIGEHNATPQGNVTFEPGLVGRAFGLDGRSAYWRIPASPGLDVGAGDGLTITAWIRPSAFDETPGHGARGPIIEWDSDTTDGVSLWANGGNSLSASLKTPTADGRTTGLQTTNGALRSGQWQLVAFTYDKKSGAATLYIDGLAVKSENFGIVRAETTYPINIGRRTGQPIGNGDSFGGLVDELALYNRALTAAELQDVFKAAALKRLSVQPTTVPYIISKKGKQPKSPKRPSARMATAVQLQKVAPQLIGWWPLNEGEGTVVHDRSSNRPPHDGQLINGVGLHEALKTELRADSRSEPAEKPEPANGEKIWDNTEPGQKSMVFDGRRYVSLGNIYQGSYTEFTIACWIKHGSSGWQNVVERGSWGDADGIGLCMDYNGSSVTFGHYPEGVKSKAVVQDNRWHHVAGTMRKEGNDYVYSIYVDGKLDNTAIGCSRGMSASTGKWTIGARDGGNWSYQGLVNDVRLYDGALTEADIKKIFLEKNNPLQAHVPAPSAVSASNVADNSLPMVVDLSPYYVNKFSSTTKDGLNNRRMVDGLPFEMGGELILYGKSDAERDDVFKAEVTDIKIGRTFDELHLIHSVRWREYYGCPVAVLRLHYADATSHNLEIRYNFQVLDWNRLLSEEREIIADPDTKIIRRSGPASWKGTGRLLKSVLKNPFPAKEVVSMDIVSTRSRASYKLLAATMAKSDPHREITAAMPLNQPEYFFGGTLKVLVVDNQTGAPIVGADVNPYMSVEDVGVVADPILTTADGVALVKYPVSRTSHLGVQLSKAGYHESSDQWQNGNIPDSITYRLKPLNEK